MSMFRGLVNNVADSFIHEAKGVVLPSEFIARMLEMASIKDIAWAIYVDYPAHMMEFIEETIRVLYDKDKDRELKKSFGGLTK